MGAEAERPEAKDAELTCTHCGERVPAGAKSCPGCGHGIYRTCFCGWRIPTTEATCPNCGANWSQSMRVARSSRATRKSRGRVPRRSQVERYAMIGAIAAVLAAVFVWALVAALARTSGDGALPASFLERVRMAREGLASIGRELWQLLVHYGGTVLALAAVAGVGALLGVAAYLVRLRAHAHARHDSRRTKRRRRR